MLKVTVLYEHPKSPGDFEKYYTEVHLPLAAKIPQVTKIELTKFASGPDGSPPAYYRMAELYYENESTMQSSLASEDGVAAVHDVGNFATGGAKIVIGVVEN